MNDVKLSSKNQIVVPRQAREALRVKAGDRLLVVTQGSMVTLLPKPKDYAEAIRGIGKDLYPKDYLKRERASWRKT